MDIKIPDSWLRKFLKTPAKPQKIAECLSLCGPSVERVEKEGRDWLYSIEVTTNRVDSAGVIGIAREATAILPRFGIKAHFNQLKTAASQDLVSQVDYLETKIDHKLCSRFTAILIKNVKIGPSPKWIQERLQQIGLRPLNNVVDISNYLMHELGQPTHTFDYDKIKGHKMTLRASKSGEKIKTLDGKTYTLPGNDIVIEDGSGRLIDLAGIMGGENSSVDEKTKNVLLFVQTYNPINIRRTSMTTGARSEAASLFEKGLGSEMIELTMRRGIDFFVKLCKGTPEGKILDLYPNPYKPATLKTTLQFIEERLGVKIEKNEIAQILSSLGFVASWQNDTIAVTVPSYRSRDIAIPEDIIEEVARLYGYHNLPSDIQIGNLPPALHDSPFAFEAKIKKILSGWGGVETYTSSLVSHDKASLGRMPSWVLKLKNPLGADSEYLRLSLAPSLLEAARQNEAYAPLHLFEMANVYLPVRSNLPEEKMTLAGIFSEDYGFASAKGIVEGLLKILRVDATWTPEVASGFLPHHRLIIKQGKSIIGQFGKLEAGLSYYEFDVAELQKAVGNISYKPLPKYPAQIEDITLILPPRTLVGQVIDVIKKTDTQITSVELIDSFENTRTFRLAYQNPDKTLTDKEVEKIRKKVIGKLKRKFGISLKS